MSTVTETDTLKQLARNVRLTCNLEPRTPYDKQSEWQRNANGYRCTLHYQGRRYSFDFWQATGIREEPTVEGCLSCLLSDADVGERGFGEFCGDFGYDEDSHQAEATWKACQRTAVHMHRLLGADFERFLYAERD